MKIKLLLSVLAVVSTVTLKAQTDSIVSVKSDSTYHLHFFLPDSAQFMDCDWTRYTIAGDTVINGKKMKKVYETVYYSAAIYEDTLNAKYYVVYENSTEEKLFMDFSANEGDLINVSNNYRTVEVQIHEVFFDENGRKIVRVKACDVIQDNWVEGIGSVSSVLFPAISTYCWSDVPESPFSRVVVEDSIVYELITAEICDYYYRGVSINDTKTDANICIYPNPAKDFLIIDAEDFDCHTYEIISASGAVQQSGELLPSIDISHLPVGVKLIVVIDDNGKAVYLSKFVKK